MRFGARGQRQRQRHGSDDATHDRQYGRGVAPGSARDGGRIIAAQEDAQVCLPGADLGVVRSGHPGEDLRDVIEIVDRPGGEQLAKGHLAQ